MLTLRLVIAFEIIFELSFRLLICTGPNLKVRATAGKLTKGAQIRLIWISQKN